MTKSHSNKKPHREKIKRQKNPVGLNLIEKVMTMYHIYFDVETTWRDMSAAHKRVAKQASPPKTYKKEETIQKWKDENPERMQKGMSLQPFGARITAIVAYSEEAGAFKMAGPDEFHMLDQFGHWLKDQKGEVKFVGYNNRKFDMPALVGAYMANDMYVPGRLALALNNPYHLQEDLMAMFPGAGGLQWAALNLGLAPITKLKGEDMPQMAQDGQYGTILEHCEDDVRCVMEIHRRLP